MNGMIYMDKWRELRNIFVDERRYMNIFNNNLIVFHIFYWEEA